ICRMLEGLKDGFLHEVSIVISLFPELYNTDRPAAYRQFDEMYQRFRSLNTKLWNRLSGSHIQRGSLFKAGRPIESYPRIIYRSVWGDQEAILNSNLGIEQRLTINDTSYVAKWDKVV